MTAYEQELFARVRSIRRDIANLMDMIKLENFRDPEKIVSVLRQAIECDDARARPGEKL
jgi:chorismate mutase